MTQTFPNRLIPSAVATFNKLHRPTQPVELLMSFDFVELKNQSTFQLNNFDFAKWLADSANRIYPGTVKSLFLSYTALSVSERNVKNIEAYLSYAQHQVKNTEHTIGALLRITDCGDNGFAIPSHLSPILRFVREIYFASVPFDNETNLEPYYVFRRITKAFQICERKIKLRNKHVKLGLMTAWTSTNLTDNIEQNKRLVDYWEIANQWAINANTSVILVGAFDNPYYEIIKLKKCGWWKLVENSSYRNTQQYVFEEKRTFFQKTPTTKSDTVGATTYWWIVGLVVLLIFFVVASVATLVVCKKICKKCCLHNTVVKEFYEGSSVVSGSANAGCITEIAKAEYKKDLELSKSEFKIDLNLLLGSGAFGAVYEGIVVTSHCETKVAVKTTMPSSPSTAMTGLLSEIKVLTYLGNHDNIVNIIGAYTKAIKKGKVYLFLELCENGSLDQYLREKIFYSNSPENGNIHSNEEDSTVHLRGSICTSIEYSDLADSNYDTGRVVEQIETPQVKVEPVKMKPDAAQLRRWCYEISNGMAFLASKNVVHADLATRNVLLTRENRAKISDFGLSRRLYEYTMYVKTHQEPLPWRWMAPESLRRLEFNEKTDVWAFGVTLWEIYSLGDLPYEGLAWSPTFSNQLGQGLRLQEPVLNEHGMYSVMLKCWNMDPSKRPAFSQLKEMFG